MKVKNGKKKELKQGKIDFIEERRKLMRYADYDSKVFTTLDLERIKKYFEGDIKKNQEELSDFIERAEKRLEWVTECEANKNYSILGRTMKDGKNKLILLIIRYPDGTQRDERYSFSKISEMRSKLEELKETHAEVDWSKFCEDI